MAQTSRFELVDQLLDGKLAEILGELRGRDVSYDDMARHFEGLGVAVSRETLRRWVKAIEKAAKAIDEEAPAA